MNFDATTCEELGAEDSRRLLALRPEWIDGNISEFDQPLLIGLTKLIRPRKVVEIGVASGWSSCVLLDTLAASGQPTEFIGVDLSETYYLDAKRPTGAAIAEVVGEPTVPARLLVGSVAADRLEEIGPGVDLAFIDGDHRHPWALLDLLSLAPVLAPSAYVLLHDLSLSTFERHRHTNRGPKYLYEGWPYHKLHSSQCPTMIGALEMPVAGWDQHVLGLLLDTVYTPWEMGVSPSFLESVAAAVEMAAGEQWGRRFAAAFAQMNDRFNASAAAELQTPNPGSRATELEYLDAHVNGSSVKFAVQRGAHDPYVEVIRSGGSLLEAMPYIFFRAEELGRKIKVVDVGANIGTVSFPLADAGHSVLAIEADPFNFICLQAGITANGFESILPVHIAATGEPSVFYIEGSSAWCQVQSNSETGSPVFGQPIVATLKAYGYADADVIKIDIEGSELPSLVDLEDLIRANEDVEIIYESNSDTCCSYGYTPQILARRFEELGFSIYTFRGTEDLFRYDSSKPQAQLVVNNLATRRDVSRVGYCPVIPFPVEWVELELRKALNRDVPRQYEHALRQQEFCRPEFVQSALWQTALASFDQRLSKLKAPACTAG